MYVIRWSTSLQRRTQYHNTTAHLSENPWMWLCPSSPVNFYKPLRALSHFSRANHRRWRGQRAPLDVLQLPMGNVSPSRRRGITNSLLSVLTRDGRLQQTYFTPVHRELCMTREGKFILSSAWRHFDKSILHISSHFSSNAVSTHIKSHK